MTTRMSNPATTLPGAFQALVALGKSADQPGLPAVTRDLVNLRVSQINGCSVCVFLHGRDLKKAGESDDRVFAVSAWRDAPWFTEPERAALALAEALTRISDQPDPVPDELWAEVARHYDEAALGGLLMTIATINVWNRLNLATRQQAGDWTG